MSLPLDLKSELLSDVESDEWGLFLDEFSKEVNGPSSKLTTSEIVKQTLHDIEDLGRKYDDYWLDEFRLFEENESLSTAQGILQDIQLIEVKSNQYQIPPNDGSIVRETQDQPCHNQDLFPSSYENAATFILSNENILYFKTGENLNMTSDVGSKSLKENEELEKENTINSYRQPSPVSDEGDVTMKMEIIDEILRNKAQELDQWGSDTCQYETGSDRSSSTSKLSSEEKGEETDDPEWSPESPVERKYRRRNSQMSWRGCSLEDKKLRKKEQNKNAATRYRQKKKAEVCSILREEEALKQRKLQLQEKVTDIQNEIRYLKGLMRELFKAKGIIN